MFELLQHDIQGLPLFGVGVQLVEVDLDVPVRGLDGLGQLGLGHPLHRFPVDCNNLVPTGKFATRCRWCVVKYLIMKMIFFNPKYCNKYYLEIQVSSLMMGNICL